MAEISDAELAEYQQLKAIEAIRAQQPPIGSDEVRPEQLTRSRALLADGSLHDYIGGHPTHVDNGAGRVPVLTVYNVP
jgi:hypothetical protein